MRSTSLAQQPLLLPKLQELPIAVIVGEKDKKFRQLYQECGIDTYLIADAGHNTHKEQPQRFITTLTQIIQDGLDSSLQSS
ncbi:alpha/beta hydrolase family protein [Vibrio gallicus]|uniref:hypothetical protein n=1 Tax=Vibrio gallicus TaxID=190897 RepID=UPI0021C2A9B0|nr:hypothetical protein [Vibrio gallicus]